MILTKKHISFTINLVLIVVITSHYLFNESFITVHDFTSGGRIYDLHQALLDGHFPPRWAIDFGFGYGMPLFQFYAPLFFVIAEIFHFIGLSIITSLKISIIISTIVGFSGMYLFAKKLVNHYGGLIAATAFSLAPYHAVNFYVRGAFSEYLAISLFPWVFLFTIQLFESSNFKLKYYIGLTISISSILLTHNVTVLTFFPLWGLFIFGLLVINFNKYKNSTTDKFLNIFRTTFIIAISFIHSFSISAFFLIPAMLTKQFTRVNDITGEFSNYQLHFIYLKQLFIANWGYGGSIWGIEDNMSFYLGNEIIFLSAISGILLIFLQQKKIKSSLYSLIKSFLNSRHSQLYLIFFLLFLSSLFLTSFKSKYLWQFLPLVKFIQFPWRFLGLASFFLAIMSSFFVIFPLGKKLWYIPIIIIVIFNARFFTPEKLINPTPQYNTNRTYIQKELSYILPDYLPPGIDWKQLTQVNSPAYLDGDGTFEIETESTDEIKLKLHVNQDSTIVFNRFTFPNWKFKLDEQLVTCVVKKYKYHCPVTSNNQTIRMYWSEQGINQISNIISIFGIFIMFCLPVIFNIIIKYKKNDSIN